MKLSPHISGMSTMSMVVAVRDDCLVGHSEAERTCRVLQEV